MHAICSQTQKYIHKNESKHSEMGPVRQNPIQGTDSYLFICVCTSLCTTVAHNTAQNRPDNFPSCPPDNRHCSDDVHLSERGAKLCGVEPRAPPIFGRAAITLGIGPHSSFPIQLKSKQYRRQSIGTYIIRNILAIQLANILVIFSRSEYNILI